MNKTTLLKSLLLAFVILVGSLSANAQLLVEDFSFSVGMLNTASGTSAAADPTTGWASHSGHGTSNISVTSSTISYPGYKSSGVGNEVTLAATGDDENKAFTSQTTGSLYAAFLVNVTTATTTGDYFVNLAQQSGSTGVTTFAGRIFAKKDASGNLAFGISKSNGGTGLINVNFTGYNYAIGTTYLIVVKYNFVSGATNDTSDLFINPTPGGTEPTPTISTSTADNATTDPTGLASFCLRQGGSTTGPTL